MTTIYDLEDYFANDPLGKIFELRRKDSEFFYKYMDYHQYFEYIKIIWGRLKKEYKKFSDIHEPLMKEMENPSKNPDKLDLLYDEHLRAIRIIQLDTESFILFARILLNKVSIVTEHMIKLPKGIQIANSFTDHKKFFTNPQNARYNPAYSELLKNTLWYEQHLLISRDKMITHGKTLTTAFLVSPEQGIRPLKTKGLSISKHSSKIIDIKKRHEKEDSGLQKVMDNAWEILAYFSKNSMSLSKEEIDFLGQVAMEVGGSVDVAGIAKNLSRFLTDVATLFHKSS